MTRIFSRSALAACAVLITACSAKKEIIAPPVTPAITVTAATTTLAVVQAASGSSVITVGRTNFAGDVNLTAETLPTGVTATFTPATLNSGATASSVSFAAASNAAVTSVPVVVTIRARGTGVTDATATISLSVTATSAGAMSITATPTTASITAGQSTSTAIAITRTGGFTGGVNFTVTGAKTGVTTTFSSANPVTANTVNLSIATLTSVAAGPDTLVVRANATGLSEASATFVVTVAAPASNSVTWRFCDPTRIPLWFAVQDGASGTWQRITEASSGVYNFSYDQPRVGIATVMNDNSTIFTQVTYYGTTEIATEAIAECRDYPTPGTKTLTGSISGFANANEVGLVSMGTALSSSANSSTPGFTINKVPTGAVDLIAVRANLVTSSVQRVLIARGTNFTAGGSIGTLDLAAGTSFAPGTGSLTITAPNDGTLFGRNVFTTATGSSASFSIASLSSGVAAAYQGVPDANMIASDLQEIQVDQSVGTTISRFVTRYTRGPGTFSLAMPLDPAVPTVTNTAGAPYSRATATGAVSASFNNLIAVQFEQPSRSRRWEMVTTSAGRAASTTYSFTMPDFSALAGWQNTWGLAAGSTDVTSSFFGQTGANPDGTPTTGTQIVLTGRFNTFTFP